MAKQIDDDTSPILPAKRVMERYEITPTTLLRWESTTDMGFPRPIVIRNRKFYRLDELEEFEKRHQR